MTGTQALYHGRYDRAANAGQVVAVIGGAVTTFDPPIGTELVYFFTDVDLALEIEYDDSAPKKPVLGSYPIFAGGDPLKCTLQINAEKQAHISINGRVAPTTNTFWVYIK